MWGPDIPPVEPSTALRHFSVALLGFIGFGVFVKYGIGPEAHFVRREYPHDGVNAALGGIEENKVRFPSFNLAVEVSKPPFRLEWRVRLRRSNRHIVCTLAMHHYIASNTILS
jgi:hypothetical protein